MVEIRWFSRGSKRRPLRFLLTWKEILSFMVLQKNGPMGFFHFLSDRDRNENNPSDQGPMIILPSINTGPISRSSVLPSTIALLCSQKELFEFPLIRIISSFWGPPCGSQTIHPNFRLFQNPNRFIENGGENRYLPRRTYFRQGVA